MGPLSSDTNSDVQEKIAARQKSEFFFSDI